MYKRTLEAIKKNLPPGHTCMCKAQFGVAHYSDIAFSIPAEINSSGAYCLIEYYEEDECELGKKKFRIRSLTPRECFRLMGVEDKNIDKIQESAISESRQYKMAGNSIAINVLEGIYENLFFPNEGQKTTLF